MLIKTFVTLFIFSFLLLSCNPEKNNKLVLGHMFDDYRSISVEYLGETTLLADGSKNTTVRITIRDKWGKSSPNETVQLLIPVNGGITNLSTKQTNQSGQVEYTIYSSTTAGTYTYELSVLNAKKTFNLTFLAGALSSVNFTLTGSNTITANGSATTSFKAITLDQYGNPVKNITVTLVIPDNGGSVAGSNPAITNDMGEFDFILISSNQAGTYTYSVIASDVAASTEIQVNFVPGLVSNINFFFDTPATLLADGASTKLITATIQDQFSNPISGGIITLNIPAGGGSVPGPSTSDITGTATFLLTSSTVAGIYNYSVSSEGLTSAIQSIAFLALDPSSIILTITGSSNILANGITTTTFSAYAQDGNGNPSDGRNINLNIPLGGGSASTPAITDSSGYAYFTLTSGTNIGVYPYTASFGGTNSNVENITFYANVPHSITLSITGATSITANGFSTSELVANVTDIGGNPVANSTINLNIPLNGGSVPGAEFTDATGTATFTLTSSLTAGTYVYSATAGTASSNTQSLTFTPSLPNMITLVNMGASAIASDGMSTTRLQAIVQDANFNVVPNVTVTLNIPIDGGTVPDINVDTDEGGAATFVLTSSVVVGSYPYSATIAGPITSNTVNVDFALGILSTLSLAITGNSTIIADGIDTTTIEVTALDAIAAPVAGEVVTLNIPVNGGSVPGSITTDALGVATFTLSSSVIWGVYNYTGSVGTVSSNSGSVNFVTSPSPAIWSIHSTSVSGSTEIQFYNEYAFVADSENGLVIMDITNALIPILATFDPGADLVTDIILDSSNNYAYLANNANGVVVIDISNPAVPALETTLNTTGSATALSISGNYLYVADGNAGLQIYDLTLPSLPIEIGSIDIPDDAIDIEISGDYAYVTATNSLSVINISDKFNPSLISTYTSNIDELSDMKLSGNYAYLSNNSNLLIVNVANPNSLNFTSTAAATSNCTGIEVFENYAYLSVGASGLEVFDISNPANPISNNIYGPLDLTTNASGIGMNGSYIYLLEDEGGVQIIDISDSTSPDQSL
ncbi:MAG: hypothetical protein A2202_08865 [Bdellovibrionales bacterium RIFOXYA1_FULL_36_14]|nr:MAG: hypothetical protein A2202_08865 [Bdellovibrionales bacterium RIFOXYA1_FULL_36_14]